MRSWDVTVTLDLLLPDEETLAGIVDNLPAGGIAGRSSWSDRLAVGTTINHTSAAGAARIAVELVEHALYEAADRTSWEASVVLGVEALDVDEAERRTVEPAPLDLVSVTEAAEMLGISPTAARARAERREMGATKVGGAAWVFPRHLVEQAANRPR